MNLKPSSLQHAQQLDPSQILAIPYNSKRLLCYTLLTVIVAFLQHGSRIFNELLTLSLYTLAVMLLSGASFTEHWIHSICAAVYWTTLAFMLEPPFLFTSTGTSFASHSDTTPSTGWFRSTWLTGALASFDTSKLVFHTTLIVTFVMQILNLYDRGWQWQRWPVPMIVGSSFGWVLGNILFVIWHVLCWRKRGSHTLQQRASVLS
jgi:hypothetical protein